MNHRKMFFKMIISSLVRRFSRMVVALLAVAIGSTILLGLTTIYVDVPRQLGKEFRSYGANLVILPGNTDHKISMADVETLKTFLPIEKVVGFAPYSYKNVKINEQPFMIAATDLEGAKANSPYWLLDGEWPEVEKEVLLGANIIKALGLKLDDNVIIALTEGDSKSQANRKVKQREYQISGSVTTGGQEESLVFMTFQDLERLTEVEASVDVIECSIEADEAYLLELSAKIKAAFPELVPRLAQRLTQSQDAVLYKLQTLVWIVMIVVLLLTMISVSTTMMAVVAERRKEIGLKKALGASNKGIIFEFFAEGLILGAFGGILGSCFGYIFADRVSLSVFTRQISFYWPLFPLTVVVAIVITGVACILPVRKTVEIDPAIVLKGE